MICRSRRLSRLCLCRMSAKKLALDHRRGQRKIENLAELSNMGESLGSEYIFKTLRHIAPRYGGRGRDTSRRPLLYGGDSNGSKGCRSMRRVEFRWAC